MRGRYPKAPLARRSDAGNTNAQGQAEVGRVVEMQKSVARRCCVESQRVPSRTIIRHLATSDQEFLNRRSFVRIGATAGGGLLVSLLIPERTHAGVIKRATKRSASRAKIGAFIEIEADGVVTIAAKNPEIGTGTKTALPMIVAEELDVSWHQVRVVQASFDQRFGDQFTGGSTGVSSNWADLRRAGATARYALVSAAAARWRVEPSACRTQNGTVIHTATGRKFGYGELAGEAASVQAPDQVPLKRVEDFRPLGTRVPNVDVAPIARGSQRYGIDVTRPGMLVATIAHAPFGARADERR